MAIWDTNGMLLLPLCAWECDVVLGRVCCGQTCTRKSKLASYVASRLFACTDPSPVKSLRISWPHGVSSGMVGTGVGAGTGVDIAARGRQQHAATTAAQVNRLRTIIRVHASTRPA